jgi:hypothetical protein
MVLLALTAYGALQIVPVRHLFRGRRGLRVRPAGPIFVPFFIVPKLDWLFWWFRALAVRVLPGRGSVS